LTFVQPAAAGLQQEFISYNVLGGRGGAERQRLKVPLTKLLYRRFTPVAHSCPRNRHTPGR